MIKINNQKECPLCGEIYDSSDNYCSYHEDLVSLAYSKDLVKICPECGMKFQDDDNFCSQHENLVSLVFIDDLVKQCRRCGAKYPEEYEHCSRCGSKEPLEYIVKTPKIMDIVSNPNKFYNFKEYSNHFTEIEDLLRDSNIEKLKDFNISKSQFDKIIEEIKSTSKSLLDDLINQYRIDVNSLKTLDKIILFSKSFVKTYYKEGGGDLGNFKFNEIHIDDRATDAIQITTIIHELSHFLISEILEQIVSIILDCNKTDALEAFVCYTLVKNVLNSLIDEYCAHTVEGRFAVLGYQDYGSYESALSDFLQVYNEDHIVAANEIGNTFAHYIKNILESFIDEDLRNDIKEEYSKINDVPNYSKLKFETQEVFEWERLSKSIKLMLTSNIEEFINNPDDIEKLNRYAMEFKKNNEE